MVLRALCDVFTTSLLKLFLVLCWSGLEFGYEIYTLKNVKEKVENIAIS